MILVNGQDRATHAAREIEHHFHNTAQYYGADGSGGITADGLTALVALAGNGAFGEELQMHDGSVFEGGSAVIKFNMHEIYVYSVGTANRPIFLELLYGTQNTGVELDGATNATNKLDKTGHVLNNGDKIMLSNSGGALPNGLNDYTSYYVVNKGANDFQVSLTSGGGVETFSDDGTGTHSYHTLNQARLASKVFSFANTNTDALQVTVMSDRQFCNNRMWCRAKALGGTNTLNYVFGIHTYPEGV